MAIVYQAFPIPPNTPTNNPARLDFYLGGHMITRIGVNFPNGCFGAVGIRLTDTNHQIAPINGWLVGNNQVIDWPESAKVNGPPWRVTLEGYSIAEDWTHTIGVYIITQ